jgi:hypothetical protein
MRLRVTVAQGAVPFFWMVLGCGSSSSGMPVADGGETADAGTADAGTTNCPATCAPDQLCLRTLSGSTCLSMPDGGVCAAGTTIYGACCVGIEYQCVSMPASCGAGVDGARSCVIPHE